MELALRKARAGAGPNAETPILAVSANVLPEARDRFVAAGMSGFPAKPLDPDSLACVIARIVPKDHETAQPDAPPCRVPPMYPCPFALDAPIARYQSEVGAFFARDPSDGSPKDLAEEAHCIAGSAAAFGQTALQAATPKPRALR